MQAWGLVVAFLLYFAQFKSRLQLCAKQSGVQGAGFFYQAGKGVLFS